ncbi:hypothetical protein M0R04_16075 [Candidatus Dojkabacteria bacterium]|jgi:hypothetical protein|nr:hypothetical protein [Candidatus Dojkabacteria bacterium]
MEKENIGNLFNDYLRESLKEKMVDAICKVNEAIESHGKKPKEEWVEILSNANKAISNVCMRNDELYSEHEYHLFEGASGVWVAQGKEVKCTNRYD